MIKVTQIIFRHKKYQYYFWSRWMELSRT